MKIILDIFIFISEIVLLVGLTDVIVQDKFLIKKLIMWYVLRKNLKLKK